MKNSGIAQILYEMADMLEIKGVDWKPVAYRRAARNIESLSEDIEKIYKEGGQKALMEIPGVGEGIAKKIAEYLEKGKVTGYEKLKREIPKGVEEMMNIGGLGPKKAYRLYRELKIDSLESLELAARAGKIRNLSGFGQRTEEDILKGLELVRKSGQRMLLGKALPLAREIAEKMKKIGGAERVDIAGSLARRKETIGDIDILVISGMPEKIIDYFTRMENVADVLAKGGTKASVVLKEGINCDLRVLKKKSYGSALNYFIGSKEHNIRLRNMAIKKGMKLSEYGLFSKAGRYLAGRTEQDIYRKLGMQYIPPEIRENMGEIEAAQKNMLPDLIQYNSVKGDLHTHTNWTDGQNSAEEMAKRAAGTGYKYLAITDHSKSTYVARGLDEKGLLKRIAEIDSVQKKFKIRLFKGAEIDILSNGNLDYSNEILKKLDIRLASIHSRFKAPKEEMTKRILRALENPYVNIFCHPTGRLINRREPYEAYFEKIFQAAKDGGVALEINSSPLRLDLNDVHIRQALDIGCKFAINTDSHSVDQLRYMEFGIAQARRGWLTERDVINAWPLKKLERFLVK